VADTRCSVLGCPAPAEFVYQGRHGACGDHNLEVARAVVETYDGFTPLTFAPVGGAR
jgi:hypothetical protein